MPAPGSSHALVLPSSADVSDEPVPPGERMERLLSAFLEPTKYTAIAVVHGLGKSAPKGFDLAKQRRPQFGGIVWVPDPEFLAELSGPNAAVLKKILKPASGYLMTFVSVQRAAIDSKLRWYHLRAAAVDKGFAKASGA